jgi:hypothetical protein
MAGTRAAPDIRADISITTQKEITPVVDVQRAFWPL